MQARQSTKGTKGQVLWRERHKGKGKAQRERCASVNAVIKRVKVSPAELAICGGDGSVTASSRDGVESNRFKTIRL